MCLNRWTLIVYVFEQVDSIDGDSVPIALLRVEKILKAGTYSLGSFNISVRRMVCKVPETASEKRARVSSGAAAKASHGGEGDASMRRKGGAGREDDSSRSAPRREYEFVDISGLYSELVRTVLRPLDTIFPSGSATTPRAEWRGSEIQILIGMIGLTGTDFTRGIPLVGAKSAYEMLQPLWRTLAWTYDRDYCMFVPNKFLNCVVSKVYHSKFQRHCQGGSMSKTLTELLSSKLSEKTRGAFPKEETLMCTVQNINWLLSYWVTACEDESQQYPDPVQECYGYKLQRGKVTFAA